MKLTSGCARCQPYLVDLVAHQVTPEKRRSLEQHLGGCDACRALLGRLATGTAALARDKPPPASANLRRRQIAMAVASASEPWHLWQARRLWAVAGVCAGVALAVLFLARHSMVAVPDIVLLRGQLVSDGRDIVAGDSPALAQPLHLEAQSDAQVQLADGSRVHIAQGSRATLVWAQGWRWQLDRGSLDCVVAKQPRGLRFVVATPQADVVVVGTELNVVATPESTLVTVTIGTVDVRVRETQQTRRLGAGEHWRIGAPTGVDPPPNIVPVNPSLMNPVPSASPAASPTPKAASRHADTTIAAEVRAQIESGHIDKARRLIERGRQRAVGEDGHLAELGMLEAEAHLAERQYGQAIEVYLDVLRNYPRTEQAEMALFAAAQLASDHHEAGVDGAQLLRRYHRAYPTGRFRNEVRRALAAPHP